MSAARPQLRALAERLGITDSYWDLAGREHVTSDATREALVSAMRFDPSSEAGCALACAALEREAAERTIEPVVVWREYAGAAPSLAVRPPAGAGEWHLEVRTEDGERHVRDGRLPAGPDRGGLRLELPALSCGRHAITLALSGPGGPWRAEQTLVLTPRTVLGATERLGDGVRGWGLWTNLYTIRSRHNWGFGDLGDLAALLGATGAAGGHFVGVNPLHAIPNRGLAITPYSPSSRLYRNPLYLEVEAVPELVACEAARARLADPALRAMLARLRDADAIDHGAVLDAKLAVLRELHAAFRAADPASARRRAFEAYRAREGRELSDFATWELLAERFGTPQRPATEWGRWPRAYRDPSSPQVQAFRREHECEVELRAWLQFELDRQLEGLAGAAREAGLPIGVYQDLAVGSAPDSADTWMEAPLFAQGVSVGAPPDDYAPDGQNWGFPPLDPHRLRADGYRHWTRLLRAGFAHAGALRIDHAMGLLRLFWIPSEGSAHQGAYVRYPLEDLLGILALESRRHGALVIAEDLGTVPPEFRERLADWGVLGSAVLYFERDDGAFRPPHAWPARALGTVETHDLVPLAGHREGTDLRIRRAVGQLADDAALAEALAGREVEHQALLSRLRAEGCLAGEADPEPAALCEAVHMLLARTPAALVAASLDDLALEREPVNVPGVPVDRHASWTRRMRRPLEALVADPDVARTLAVLASRTGTRPGSG